MGTSDREGGARGRGDMSETETSRGDTLEKLQKWAVKKGAGARFCAKILEQNHMRRNGHLRFR